MNISIILPTRKRVHNLKRLIDSVKETAKYPDLVEFCFYIDNDDTESRDFLTERKMLFVQGERIVLSDMWNKAYELATSDIAMQAGDDVVFRTPGWDQIVMNEFDKSPDKLIFVHGDDLGDRGKTYGTHGFLHRRWIETVGYFLPPYFSSDYSDTWLNEVANMLDRRVYVPIVTEHMHFGFGKAEKDQTYAERMDRGDKDNVNNIYQETLSKRIGDSVKLKRKMSEDES